MPAGIVIDPRNSDVYAGLSEGGVYKSFDQAENWHRYSQGMLGTVINDLAVHPIFPDTVYAAVKGRGHHLSKTFNAGNSWDYLTESSTHCGAVAFDPQNPTTLYTGFGWYLRSHPLCYLSKSTDGGQNWTNTGSLFYTFGTVWLGIPDIWVNPGDSNTILVAVAGFGLEGGGIYKSTDGGTTWGRTLGFWASSLAADPDDHDIFYAGTAQVGYVFQSTDGGENWTRISPGEEWVWEVRDIEVDLNTDIYAATDEGLMKWNGSDWIELTGLPTDDITALAIDRSTAPGIVYVGTGEHGVFVSQDGGSTWMTFSDGLGNLAIAKLAVSSSQPKMLYAGTAYGGVWSRRLSHDPLPDISVSPVSFNFGNVNVGSTSASQTLTVSNTGLADLVIGTLSITGTDDSEFSIQNDNCSGQTIAPSGICTVDVTFSPTSLGLKSANLSVPSNDPGLPILNVPLRNSVKAMPWIPLLLLDD